MPIDSRQMDVKSLIQGMLSPSKADLWVVMLYTNYRYGMNFVKCVYKMEKDHYVVTALVHLRNITFYQIISLIQAGRIWHLYKDL